MRGKDIAELHPGKVNTVPEVEKGIVEFTVYPAIDLRAGAVVRLRQGDPRNQTEYSVDPRSVALGWLSAGAGWLHVVNLDGAFGQASPGNHQALEAILVASGKFKPKGCVQLGGGLRDRSRISQALALGVRRVILGTLAVESPQLVERLLEEFGPDRIVVGIDAREGQVLSHGWARASALKVLDLCAHFVSIGLQTVIYTDVHRDGTGAGINILSSQELAEQTGLRVIASGGVDSLDDVRAAKDAGLAGVIIGRALYEGHFSLEEALRC